MEKIEIMEKEIMEKEKNQNASARSAAFAIEKLRTIITNIRDIYIVKSNFALDANVALRTFQTKEFYTIEDSRSEHSDLASKYLNSLSTSYKEQCLIYEEQKNATQDAIQILKSKD